MKTDHLLLLGVAAVLWLSLIPSPVRAVDAKEKSKDIIAVQIRKQGFACNKPQSAEHDTEASKPDAEVWTLKCEGVTYKVKLIPNMAATVEKLPDEKRDSSHQ